jgi:hypothetical protein
LGKIWDYRINWIWHVNRMPCNRLPRMINSCAPKEKEPGKTTEETFGCVRMNRSTIGPTAWQLHDYVTFIFKGPNPQWMPRQVWQVVTGWKEIQAVGRPGCTAGEACACNETNLMHYLSSVYSVTIPLHVLGLLVAHRQEVTMYICDNWYVLYVLVDCRQAWMEWNSITSWWWATSKPETCRGIVTQ